MSNHSAGSPARRTRWVRALAIAALTMCIVIVAIIFAQQSTPKVSQSIATISSVPTPISSPALITAPASEPAPVVTTAQPVADSTPPKAEPTRIIISDARIDMSVLLLPQSSIVDGVLTPPETPDAYWVDAFDKPGSDSTDLTLIVSHACEGLPICEQMDWQFSRLSSPDLITQGTTIAVETKNGTVCYAADTTPVVYEKASLQNENEDVVFGNAPRPGKLVLISCYTADTVSKNVVVVATRKPC